MNNANILNNLDFKLGIFWTICWILALMVLGKKPFNYEVLKSGIIFFILWTLSSITLSLLPKSSLTSRDFKYLNEIFYKNS